MFTISKQFEFSASHQLSQLPEEHPCFRLHGHNYVITFLLESKDLNKDGFVLDYRELAPVKMWLDLNFDHRHLNDILPHPPTAENIARYLYDRFIPLFPALRAVQVSETPKTNSEYRPYKP